MLLQTRLKGVGLACFLMLAALPRLAGQGATATIQGTVTDTTGAVIPEASIQIKNVGTGAILNSQSDPQGRFGVPDLGVGNYEAQASKMGFQTVVRKGITLTVGGEAVIDFSLPVGQSQQTVTVDAEVTQVETTNASVGSLTDQRQMSELPLNGRNFEQLILLAPGVQSITAYSPSAFQGRAPEYSIAGGRPTGQAILLDDETLQNFWNKGMGSITGTSLGIEAIGEFQTLTDTYGAQYGGNGAVINSVSKSGTNSFHGSAYDFLRNSALDARNFFDPHTIPAFRRNQFGGSIGGPIKKDKTFFFVNYEGLQQLLGETKVATVPACNVPGVCTITATNPATAQAIAQTLAIFPAPTSLISSSLGHATEVANQTSHENYVLGRFDYNISEKDSLFVRYVSDKADLIEPFAGGGTGSGFLDNWPEQDASHAQFATVEERRIFTPTLVNVSRVSFSRPGTSAYELASVPVLQFFPGAGRQDGQVTITGLSGLGGDTFDPFVMIQNRYTEADDVLWTRGAHSIRFGISASRLQSNTDDQFRAGGTYSFQSLPLFLAGQAFTFTGIPLVQPSGQPAYANRDWRNVELTPYIQDDWKVTSKLTVNLGLRYEFYTNPHDQHNQLYAVTNFVTSTGFTQVPNTFASNPTTKNFDPRVGFAYDPFADHKTSIRAGFGIFHELVLPATFFPSAVSSPPWNTVLVSSPTFPNPLGAAASYKPTQSPGFDWNMNTTPYMIQYNINVQREVSQGTVLNVGYVGSHGVHLLTEVEMNPPIPTIDSSGVYHFAQLINGAIVTNPRLNPNLSIFPQISALATSDYNALQASLNRRLTRNVQAQVSYTYSKCISDGEYGLNSFASNAPASFENPYNFGIDRGPCSYDITQTLRVNALVALPFHGNRLVEGWQLSGIESANTGTPFTIETGFDQVGLQGGDTPRPNYIAGCNPTSVPGGQSVSEWYNPACYSLEAPGTLGNVGRDTVRGPNFVDTDFAVLKSTKIRESLNLQFRAEIFNLFNHPEFAIPGITLYTAGANGTGNPNPNAGRIVSTVNNAGRQIQFALKLVF